MRNVIGELLSRAENSGAGITIFDGDNKLVGHNRKMKEIYKSVEFAQAKTVDDIITTAFINNEVALPKSCYDISEYIRYVIAYHKSNSSGTFVRKIADGRYFMMTHQRIAGEDLWCQTRQDITGEIASCQVSSNMSEEELWLLSRRRTFGGDPIAAILQAVPGPAALVGVGAKIIGVNEAFSRLVRRGEGVRLTHDCVAVSDASQQTALRNHVVDLLSSRSGVPVILRISRPDGMGPYFMRLSTINIPDGSLWLSTRRAVLLAVIDPDRRQMIDPGVLSGLMGISHAEAEVAVAMTSGMSVQDIAEMRNVSANTVSHQLKSILIKTGLNSKIDIVRQITYLSSMVDTAVYDEFR